MVDRNTQRGIARATLARCGVPYPSDFHRLGSAQVEALLKEAKAAGYRQPKNANGSRARYFHVRMQRHAARES